MLEVLQVMDASDFSKIIDVDKICEVSLAVIKVIEEVIKGLLTWLDYGVDGFMQMSQMTLSSYE